MKIFVVGAGNIGGTLGQKWAAMGHEVVFGVRDPVAEKVQALLAAGGGMTAVSSGAVPEEAEVVVFAVPGPAMADLLAEIGDKLGGKIVIDATNDIRATPMDKLGLLREAGPDCQLFRAFSNLGWENFAEPEIDGQRLDLFYCGDEGAARTAVESLINDIGLGTVYVGGVEQAGIIDGLTRLWFALALQQGYGRHTGLKLLAETAS